MALVDSLGDHGQPIIIEGASLAFVRPCLNPAAAGAGADVVDEESGREDAGVARRFEEVSEVRSVWCVTIDTDVKDTASHSPPMV